MRIFEYKQKGVFDISSITLFTPTYNRKSKLQKCYESLIEQTDKDFIWQIVDDGSTDNTDELVQTWIETGEINIVYYKKDNGGKASAINYSLDATETSLWLTLDSDDYLFPNAIEIIKGNYELIKDDNDICGMFALRSLEDGQPMQGKEIPDSIKYSTQSNIRYNLGIEPEYLHVYKTKVIKQYKYPIIPGEKYFPLSYIFDQLDQKYRYLILHESIMVCEYQSDGMTKNKRQLIKKNPIGYTLYKRQLIELAPNLGTKIKASANYTAGCLLSKKYMNIFKSPNILLSLLTFPIGLMDYTLRYLFMFRFDLE